jgi:hypothetical protein
MRRLGYAILLLLLLSLPAAAQLLSRSYEFKQGATLELGVATEDGLRVDTLRFNVPATTGGRYHRTGGAVTVDVALSNTAEAASKVGIAVALFDDQSRLLGVASGGSRLVALKPDRQKTYRLIFEDVNAEAFRAATFQISVESKP